MKIMKIRIIISIIFLLVLNSGLAAQQSYITKLSFTKSYDGYQCRIISSKKVPYGSIWLPQNKRLVIYVRESRLEGNDSPVLPEEGPVKKISARQLPNVPNVVEIMFDFKIPRKYSIDYDGLDIVTYIGQNQAEARKPVRVNQSYPKRIERTGPLYATHKISMDYFQAALPNVLRLLAKQNNLNIIGGNNVSGNVTLSLRDVTIREALDNILMANGYNYVINDNVVVVKPGNTYYPTLTETRVYQLKYIDAQNLKNVITPMLPEGSKIQVFSPQFFSEMAIDEKKPAGKTDGIKKRSSTLLVTDTPEVLEKLDDIIRRLDVAPRQIVIESKLLELSPSQNDKIGIDWDKTLTASLMADQFTTTNQIREFSAINNGLGRHDSWKLGNLSASQFSVVLDFLKQHTDTKLVSNPRVVATDNVTSRISVGTTFPVPQINRGAGGQGDIVTFVYKEVNIQLNVTPHVVDDDKIIMHVNPVIEEITGEVVVDVNRAPITSKRIVETIITVKDGETIVIGGMIKEDSKKIVSKVFLLGDIPLLGKLFRHTEYISEQKDLIIFITPHILKQQE